MFHLLAAPHQTPQWLGLTICIVCIVGVFLLIAGILKYDDYEIRFEAKTKDEDPFLLVTSVCESQSHIREMTQEEAEKWKEKATEYFNNKGVKASELSFEVSYVPE